MPRIEIRGVAKSYGATRALKDVSLEISPGTCLGIVGENGAGKSTLLRLMAGLERPDDRGITIESFNLSVNRDYQQIKKEIGIGYAGPDLLVYGELSVEKNLQLLSSLRSRGAEEVEQVLAKLELDSIKDRLPGQCSLGMQKRVAIAQAIVHRPGLLLLDEPLANLDVHSRKKVTSLICDLKGEGCMIVIATHDQNLIEVVCDVALTLKEGRVVH